jgi:hypothetical protein
MRSLILAAAAAMLVAGVAGRASAAAGPANGPYAWDAGGDCRDASGAVVTQSLCPARPKPAACVDQSSGKPVACDAPNAAPPESPPAYPPH